jgi:hypothetical protein
VVQHDVAGDGDQPGADVAALEGQRVDPAQRADERLAGEVLGRRPVTDPVVEVPEDDVDVPVVEQAETLGVPLLRAADEFPDRRLVGLAEDLRRVVDGVSRVG